MAIDPKTIQWDAPPQTVGKPVTGSVNEPLGGGVIIPAAPDKPNLPSPTRETERWTTMTPEEVRADPRLNPSLVYQRNAAGKIEPIGGAAAPQVDPNRPMQIKSALSALSNIRELAKKTLSVGKQAGRVGEYPIIGGFLGQNRADLESSLALVEGNLIQDQLARLSKINPGGIASLANSETEARRLASAVANLDPNQSEAEFLKGVQRAEDYYRSQAGQLGIEIPPAPSGGGTGPNVIVTPEQSIQRFGQLTYDENGQLVGDNFAGMAYNADGSERGLVGSVSDETLQQDAPSFFGSAIGAVTGADQSTETTQNLPDWVEMPGINDLLSSAAWKTGLGTAFGGSPQEIAQIVQSNFPGTQVWQDEKGNYILRSAQDGKDYAIKPGFQVSDIPRAGNIIGLGLLGGGGAGATALRTGATEAALQAGIETTQAATGGTFNPSDIAAAGTFGAAGQKAADLLPSIVQRVRGQGGGPMGGGPSGGAPAVLPMGGGPRIARGTEMGGSMPPAGGMPPSGGVPGGAAPTGGAPVDQAAMQAADETFIPQTFRFNDAGSAGTPLDLIRPSQAAELGIDLMPFQKTRNFKDMQRAHELAKNGEIGLPIRKRLSEQQAAIAQKFDDYIESTGSNIREDIVGQGAKITDAMGKMLDRDKAKVRTLYTRAGKSDEAKAVVPLSQTIKSMVDGEEVETTVVDWLNSQPTGLQTSGVTDAAKQLAVKLGIASLNKETGNLVAKQPTIKQMEMWRREINQTSDFNDSNLQRQKTALKRMIDAHTEPYATGLYAEARAARRDISRKYEDVSTIAQLLKTRKNTPERLIASEKVVESILKGGTSVANVKALRDLIKGEGGDPQAWKEVQGATLEYLRKKAFGSGSQTEGLSGKGVQIDEFGNRTMAVKQFENAVNSLDESGKLDVLLGFEKANAVRNLAGAANAMFTAPPGSVNFANTSSALWNAADMLLNATLFQLPLPAGVLSNAVKPLKDFVKDRPLKKEVRRLVGGS